ncbi:hypothetical protein [Micromonospora cathayae]|uniref:PEP-CTERM protein-sorting domain-containing protein n=1 Tax=Micromonospora cathayae TaxID=3028804 RepID=A0ABY7ZVQ4_9ACTN|nr:hypothetical protein [Micromonospora sp. HUAS 3]WDZ87070.1 hypothetical protein PVK37_12020 [Micromonospora sp. HUAS 3]
MKRSPLAVILISLGAVAGFALASTVGDRNPETFVVVSAVFIVLVLVVALIQLIRRGPGRR